MALNRPLNPPDHAAGTESQAGNRIAENIEETILRYLLHVLRLAFNSSDRHPGRRDHRLSLASLGENERLVGLRLGLEDRFAFERPSRIFIYAP